MHILMLGRNAAMLQMGATPITAAGHQVTTCLTDDEAQLHLSSKVGFGALVFGMAVEQGSRAALRAYIADNALSLLVLEPMGPMDLPKLLAQLA
jgi:hypothetical protein